MSEEYSKIECGHCQNAVTARVVGQHSQVRSHTEEGPASRLTGPVEWDTGPVFQLLECPACKGVSLERFYFHSEAAPGGEQFEILFPLPPGRVKGLPAKVAGAYEAARIVRNLDPNLFSVALRRTLELVLKEKGATGDTVEKKIDNLLSNATIPQPLADLSHKLRKLANIGAHGGDVELEVEEIPLLDDLVRAILEYLYVAPELVRRAEESLERLKKKRSE